MQDGPLAAPHNRPSCCSVYLLVHQDHPPDCHAHLLSHSLNPCLDLLVFFAAVSETFTQPSGFFYAGSECNCNLHLLSRQDRPPYCSVSSLPVGCLDHPPYCDATRMTRAVDSSAQKPRVGDSLARRTPMALSSVEGHKETVTDPGSTTIFLQRGVGSFVQAAVRGSLARRTPMAVESVGVQGIRKTVAEPRTRLCCCCMVLLHHCRRACGSAWRVTRPWPQERGWRLGPYSLSA